MLINITVWGAALPVSKFAVNETSAFLFLFYRFAVALIFSLPILIFYWRKYRPSLQEVGLIIILELLGTSLALGSLYLGLQRTTTLEASLLTSTIPLFVTLGGIIFLREVEESSEWIGLLIALAGTLLITLEPILTGRYQHAGFSLLGNLLVMLSNLAYAAYILLAKKYYQRLPKLLISSLSFWIGVITFLILSAWQMEFDWLTWQQTVWTDLAQPLITWPAIYMGIFGSIIGLTTYIAGHNLIEASEASLFTYLQPLIYIPLAYFLHGEQMQSLLIVAVGFIALGVLIGEIRWKKIIFSKN